jgi:ATP-dependent DNA helicase RecQ
MEPLPAAPSHRVVLEALAFLKRSSLPIEPRKKWPDGGMPRYGVKGGIPAEQQTERGEALCIWGDAGWGILVKTGKYREGRFSDDLVRACVEMVRVWNPQPAPAWVTSIPSLRHPILVRDFAERLAEALGLRFEVALRKVDHRPEQKTMANSTQQARNLDGALEAAVTSLPSGSVLLVDDLIDSRWTVTVAGWLLRKHELAKCFH